MTVFPISFSFNEHKYEAIVHKIESYPIQYLVSEFNPLIGGPNTTYVISVEYSDPKKLVYLIDGNFHFMGGEISKAIIFYCENNNLDVFR
jgi:hypothetical protein